MAKHSKWSLPFAKSLGSPDNIQLCRVKAAPHKLKNKIRYYIAVEIAKGVVYITRDPREVVPLGAMSSQEAKKILFEDLSI